MATACSITGSLEFSQKVATTELSNGYRFEPVWIGICFVMFCVGFRDKLFYENPPITEELDRDACLKLFEEYKNMDKVIY